MLDPQKLNAESIMPPYPWLIENDLDVSNLSSKIRVLTNLGTPYPEGYADGQALADLNAQAKEITSDLKNAGIEVESNKQIIALIAYLQRLGVDLYNGNSQTSQLSNQ